MSGYRKLAEFLRRYDDDDNIWWVLGSGDHQNLFDDLFALFEEVLDKLTIAALSSNDPRSEIHAVVSEALVVLYGSADGRTK